MTVKELIEILQTLNPDAEVVVSSDEEGNSYSPIENFSDDAFFNPEAEWGDEISDTQKQGYGPCVILWPRH